MDGRKNVKSIVPNIARDYLYVCNDKFRLLQDKRRRKCVFESAINKFIENPIEILNSRNDVITDLIYGWANEQWSALDMYLRHCLKHAFVANGPILECGSGLTTILLGIIAGLSGNMVWSLEHNQAWGRKVNRYLGKYQIKFVKLIVGQLKDFGEFMWYDPPLDDMPQGFSMVVCDGPPAGTKGGRFGLLPVMKERLRQGAVILLDDADRAQENSIALRWTQELKGDYQSLGTINPYIVISIPHKLTP